MQYKIDGGNLPVLKIQLEEGETVQCEAGAMSWMDNEIQMNTQAGGIGKMFGRLLTNENAFLNTYVARRKGEIAFSSKFPGAIVAIELNNSSIVIQKGAFLASVGNIENEVFFRKKLGTGLFGGEGFLMRRYHGTGIVFLEIDGSSSTYEIPSGDCKIVNTGYVVAMDDTCRMDIQSIKGVKNVLFGGEGLFNTVVYGPGKVILQSMPISATAMQLYRYMPHPSSH